MGEYFTWLTIPANTSIDNPVTKTIEVEGEVLSEIAYLIPSGWAALAHFSICYGIKQIYPYIQGTWVTGDNLFRQVPIKWTLPETPCRLVIKGYNQDDTYPHTLYLWLLIKPEEEVWPLNILVDFVRILKRLLGIG